MMNFMLFSNKKFTKIFGIIVAGLVILSMVFFLLIPAL